MIALAVVMLFIILIIMVKIMVAVTNTDAPDIGAWFAGIGEALGMLGKAFLWLCLVGYPVYFVIELIHAI